jgi:hypothetical protein
MMAITIQDNSGAYPQDYPTNRVLDPPLNRWQQGATPPLPPSRPGGLPTSQPDYSVFDSVDPRQNPTGPSGPAPSTPVQGNPFFNFLSSLFGRSGGSAPQGMTGLLARGQGASGTDALGNPFNRF